MAGARSAVRLAAFCAASAMAIIASPVAVSAKGYAALDRLPDWSGVWGPDWSSLFAGRGGNGPPTGPKLTPPYAKLLADYNARKAQGENLQSQAANCVPPGMPSIMRMPYPIEFLYSPERVTIVAETDSQVRRIYTDGRKLPDDPDPAFNGSSVGHWEGDTLVVDTIGLNPDTNLSEAIHPTDKTHIQERIRMTKPGIITITTTISDPAIYVEPYTTTQNYIRHGDWTMREYVCEENNRDAADPFGRPSLDISNPGDKK